MRTFTAPQTALLQAPALNANMLATFFLDSGTYYFCDDVINLSDGTNTYIGANALTDSVEITSGSGLSAESITMTLDGARMTQYGIADPASVLSSILGTLYTQRRVNINLGLRYPQDQLVDIVIPLYSGLINYARLIDKETTYDASAEVSAQLEIVIDSIAVRYSRTSNRVRSDSDQREVNSADGFYSFTSDAVQNEQTLYWGMATPYVATPSANQGLGGRASSRYGNIP